MNPNINRVIIYLETIPEDVYDSLIKLGPLYNKEEDRFKIWDAYPKFGDIYDTKINSVYEPIFETYLTLNYCREIDVPSKIWYQPSLFIYNDNLYRIHGRRILKVDLEKVYFHTLRETMAHPFFSILSILLEKNNGKIAKPNQNTMVNIKCKNKMHAIKLLYKHRSNYLQDIIIPYNIKQKDYNLFMRFVHSNLGDKVVFKNDCIQGGKGVIFRDLSKGYDSPELIESFKKHNSSQNELLITPAYDIQSEYRCYFTYFGNQIKVFSIKQRKTLTQGDDLFTSVNAQIYKSIAVEWVLIDSKTQQFNDISLMAEELIKQMDYDTGCIEFAITKEEKLVFFEVNYMSGPLTYPGQDLEDMDNYYQEIFKNVF